MGEGCWAGARSGVAAEAGAGAGREYRFRSLNETRTGGSKCSCSCLGCDVSCDCGKDEDGELRQSPSTAVLIAKIMVRSTIASVAFFVIFWISYNYGFVHGDTNKCEYKQCWVI